MARLRQLDPTLRIATLKSVVPSPADLKAPQSCALHKFGVGGGYGIPNIPESKNAERFWFGTD